MEIKARSAFLQRQWGGRSGWRGQGPGRRQVRAKVRLGQHLLVLGGWTGQRLMGELLAVCEV